MASNSACSISSGEKTAVSPALPFADTAKRLQLVLLGRGITFILFTCEAAFHVLSWALPLSTCPDSYFFTFGLAAERPSRIATRS